MSAMIAREEQAGSDRKSGLNRMAGPVLLWGLGVGYVISGDYYGWNSGLISAGYRGYLVAVGGAAVLYGALALVIGELTAAVPDAAGPSAFARLALGSYAGYFCGLSVLMEYLLAAAAIATAVGAYLNFLVAAIPPVTAGIGIYIFFTVVHWYGVSLSLKLELALTGLAVLMLVVFYFGAGPHFSLLRLDEVGHGALLPHGFAGLWDAFPSAAWLFLGIEGLPMAVEEARDATRNVPRALLSSFATLCLLAAFTPAVVAGLGGAATVGKSDAPLPSAVAVALGSRHWLATTVSVVGLVALLASFHAIILSYSRQLYSLSRAGYLPGFLAQLNRRKTPSWALVLPGLFGSALVGLGPFLPGSAIPILVTVSVFGAAISYVMMIVSAIALRRRREFVWPLRMFGGEAKAWIALGLSLLLLLAGAHEHPFAVLYGGLALLLLSVFYFVYGRARVAVRSLEEELRALRGEIESGS
jgi:ethanolamine permease